MSVFAIVLIVIAIIIVYAIVAYNSLVSLRNQVQNSWRQIDVQLKRRHDLIPNLVEAVKGYMQFERDTLTQVVEARAKAVQAPDQGTRLQAENQLSFARQAYNDVVMRLNTKLETFPTNLIAAQFGFSAADYFKAAAEDQAVPKVDLSLGATRS